MTLPANYIERIRRYYIDVSKNAVDARDITITAMERADKERIHQDEETVYE
ncbi:MAG: hypothetical protein MZV63_25530 [Marinilabiliales bacterium]|nr:hypothetical protein [Marinilabiliales bacterium]